MLVRVQARDIHCEFTALERERILHAGLRAGVQLPYECGSGTCGKCRAVVMDGEIEDHWPAAPGKRMCAEGSNEFLMCQCSAASDLTVAIPRHSLSSSADALPVGTFDGVLLQARSLAPDVASFVVELDRPCPFEAGQFVLLQAPGIAGFRAYSMCNYGDAPQRLELLIRRKRGGGFSEWLFAGSREGERLEVFGPMGKAIFQPTLDRNIACIAGGSGIAGMMSILACADAARHFARYAGYVFFGVRTLADGFFLERLTELARRWPRSLSVVVALSDEPVPERACDEWPAIRFAQGWVHVVARDGLAGRFGNLRAYVAGPPPAVEAATRMLLVDGKLPVAEIRYDKFG